MEEGCDIGPNRPCLKETIQARLQKRRNNLVQQLKKVDLALQLFEAEPGLAAKWELIDDVR